MKLKRLTQLSTTKLNTLIDEDFKNLDHHLKPIDMIGMQDIDYDEINFEFDDQLILDNLIMRIDNDAECGIIIYELFNSLDVLTLLDPGFWNALSVDIFWKYTFLKYFKENENAAFIYNNNCLLTNSYFTNLLSNSIARLFWITKMTVTNTEDQYELTKFVFENPKLIDGLLVMDFMLNDACNKILLEQIMKISDYELAFSKTDEDFLDFLIFEITVKASYSFFDFCSQQEIKEFIDSIVLNFQNKKS